MVTVEVYSQKSCLACKTEVPRIIREANALGIEVRTIDVDRCPVDAKNRCARVEYVPMLMYQGREIGISDLAEIARGG